jgi:hypothetical protein
MKIIKSILTVGLVMLCIFASSLVSVAGNVYQVINLKDDGSGTIKLSYSADNKMLQKFKFILGNYPFTEKLAKEYFSSQNTTVQNAKLNFDIKDSTYFMTLEIDFKNINKINQAKGFSGIVARWFGTDTGAVFNYTILAGKSTIEYFDPQSYIVNFENSVKSTNGVKTDKNVTWGNRTSKNTNFSKDQTMAASTSGSVPKSLDTTPASPMSQEQKTAGKDEKQVEKSEKSCGLFGFELPLILLAGYVFSLTSKRRKS